MVKKKKIKKKTLFICINNNGIKQLDLVLSTLKYWKYCSTIDISKWVKSPAFFYMYLNFYILNVQVSSSWIFAPSNLRYICFTKNEVVIYLGHAVKQNFGFGFCQAVCWSVPTSSIHKQPKNVHTYREDKIKILNYG